jgi:hypothetical protein
MSKQWLTMPFHKSISRRITLYKVSSQMDVLKAVIFNGNERRFSSASFSRKTFSMSLSELKLPIPSDLLGLNPSCESNRKFWHPLNSAKWLPKKTDNTQSPCPNPEIQYQTHRLRLQHF